MKGFKTILFTFKRGFHPKLMSHFWRKTEQVEDPFLQKELLVGKRYKSFAKGTAHRKDFKT